MKGRRNIIKAVAALLVLTVLASCLPFGMAFAADRPSNGGYSNFVDDSYSETTEKSEVVNKVITASKLVYTTSTSSTATYKSYSKDMTANAMIPLTTVNAYFTVDVYGAYKAYVDANPNSVVTLKSIIVEQQALLAGGSSTVNVSTGYSINGGMVDVDTIKPIVSAGTPIAVNSSKTPLSSVTEITAETILSGLTSEAGMYFVWYVGQSSKTMYYYAPSVTLVLDVYTKTTTDYNNDTSTANGSNGTFTQGTLDIDKTEKVTSETVDGQKIYLGAYNNGYVGSSSYGSSSGTLYTSVGTDKKNPKTDVVLTSNYNKFSIPYKASAYLNYDLNAYLDYIESTLIAQGKRNVKITITSVDMYAKVRMGYTGSYSSSYAPYDNIAVSVAPSWSGSSYPSSNYQQVGDYYANYAYNVSVYLATSLTADQVKQLNTTKAFTVRLQSTDYYGYYDYISTEAYLWTLVEDYPTIAVNYSYTCDNVEETVVDNTVKTDLYVEHKFYDANDALVMGKTKFVGTLTGVGAKAVVTPYTSGTVNNLYSYSKGIQSASNTSSAIVSADEYVLQRAYVDNGDGNVISINTTSAKSSYTVTYLASSLAQASDGARVIFEYKKGKQEVPAVDFEYKSVDMTYDNGKLTFTVVTSPANINRVKIFDTADSTSYVKLISTYTVNAQGNYVWTATINAPSADTTYGFDVRSNEDNKYLKNYVYKTYSLNTDNLESDTTVIKNVVSKVEDGNVIFTVTTAPNVANRIKVSAANALSDYIAYTNGHTVDANGNWVWTIKIAAPSDKTAYAFDARLVSTGKYAKAYFYATVNPSDMGYESDTSIFTSATAKVEGGKVIFTVVSKSSVAINRVRVAPATAPTDYITYVSKSTTDAQGNYVWTLTIDAPAEKTVYAIDARLTSTGKYAKAYYYVAVEGSGSGTTPTPTPTPTPDTVFKSVSASISDNALTFVITTAPVAINRIKVMNSADMKTNLALVSNYTVDANGDYVWVVTVDAPTATTTYAFDARSSETGSYLKKYYYSEINPDKVVVVEPEIKSVSHAVSAGQVVFTVVTSNANINRVKLCDQYGDLLSYVSQCTRNANGDYEWILTAPVEKGTTTYTFYMRNATTGLYIDEGFAHSVTYNGEDVNPIETPIEKVTYTTNGGIVTFTVTTDAGEYNRIKVAYLNDLSKALAYTDKYVVNEDGKYVWTLSVSHVAEDVTYSFDLRSSETNKYLKKYYDEKVSANMGGDTVDSVIFKSVKATTADGKITFTVETYKGYNRIKVSLASAPSSYIKYTSTYVETEDSLIWTLVIDEPAENTEYSFGVRPDGATSYLKERMTYTYKVKPSQDKWGTLDANGLYTAVDGGYQIVLPGWVHYGTVQGADTLAASYTAPTSALFAYVYDVVDPAVFDNYTSDDFAAILGTTVESFRKTTVGDGYTCYVVCGGGMHTYTFQTENARYFLNFMQANDGVDIETFSNTAMTNIVIY
ncbi:MAG: hypothetical protein IKU25_07785 [Clostridia bacterium]|nr:hypothetical protein [Clostridia bacterium]